MDWLSYGAREYDPAIGRFFGVDPVIEKFPYLTTYNYASNDPIKNIDLWGLQGISYSEVDANGNSRQVVELNVVVLTEQTKEIPIDATEKQRNKLEKKNARIERRNAQRVSSIAEDLNSYYNTSENTGSLDEKGNEVFFRFNISAQAVENTADQATAIRVSQENALQSGIADGRGGFIMVDAAVITTQPSKGHGGSTRGKIVQDLSPLNKSSEGVWSHEIGHTFGLPDSYGNGRQGGYGIMGNPVSNIDPREITEIINISFRGKNGKR